MFTTEPASEGDGDAHLPVCPARNSRIMHHAEKAYVAAFFRLFARHKLANFERLGVVHTFRNPKKF